jgi:integrase
VIRAVIAKALGDAVDDRLLSVSPVGPPLRDDRKTQPGRFRCWTPRELSSLLGVTDRDDRLAALWRVLVATGCRRSEALGLQWLGFSVEQGTLSFASQVIPAKGGARLAPLKTAGSARTVSLDATTVAFLERHREIQLREREAAGEVYADADLVFASPLGGVLRPEVVTRMFHVHREAAGIPQGRLHDVRHSVASLWLSRGVPIVVVSARLGHASAATTLRVYSHVLDRDDARAASMMADLASL